MHEVALRRERIEASVRANVEHAFCRIKQQCGYRKVRYRGLEHNTNRLQVPAAFSNLLTGRRMVPV